MDRYFYKKNPWWENESFDYGIVRSSYTQKLEKDFSQRIIQIITGLRRVGKSTIVMQLINALINKRKLDPKRIIYFSIEEPSISQTPIIDIVNEFRSEHGIKFAQKIFVFIDEIQFRKDWEQEIKSLYESENIKFVLTGSSAMLLSEKLSYLTGRYLKTQVYPLTFLEYLDFKKIKTSKVDNILLLRHLEDYLNDGGMPEYVISKPDRYLETTVESILFKDLVSKFQLRNPAILSDMIYLLADRVGSTSSSLKLSKILDVNKDTILAYLEYLNKTYLTSRLSNYSTSRNKEIYNPDKMYFVDTGVLGRYASKPNMGAIAENALFSHIKRSTESSLRVKFGYWYEDKNEIDFVLSKGKDIYIFESKWVDRVEEIRFESLLALLKIVKPKKIFFLTRTLKAKKIIDSHEVMFFPLYEFLTQDLNTLL